MMKTGTMPKQGDIVLIPVPFTDLSSQKRRPVIVILNDDYNQATQDIVAVALTSNPEETTHSFTITNTDLTRGALKRPSRVRVDKIYTLAQNIIVKNFGAVNGKTLEKIRDVLKDLTD